jgi:hypothetical protein
VLCDQDTAFPIIFFNPQAFLDKERLLPAKGGHTTVAPTLPRVPVGLIAVILQYFWTQLVSVGLGFLDAADIGLFMFQPVQETLFHRCADPVYIPGD